MFIYHFCANCNNKFRLSGIIERKQKILDQADMDSIRQDIMAGQNGDQDFKADNILIESLSFLHEVKGTK